MRAPPAVCSLLLAALAALAGQAAAQSSDGVDFAGEILPLFESRCFECHGPGPRIKSGLRLTSRETILEGGSRGPAVDLVAPAESLLLAATSYEDEDARMPPDGKLSDAELALLRRWVELGAPWDPSVVIPVEPLEHESRHGRNDGLAGWSYRPLVRPSVPEVADRAWVANPIDAFVLAQLEPRGLAPTPPAEPVAWLRRVTYGLTGLPPSPEEVDAYAADPSPAARERIVEQLLASPQYGVHWGRRWLDLVRYAETNGYERDGDKPFIWRYRDWVIDAFNRDLPYDRFVLAQLAGDELDDRGPEDLVATGYLRLMLWDDEPPMGALQARYDVLDDLVRTTSETFLGMTMGCARCHDHKGDPVTQEDYYSFMAFFQGLSDYRTEGTLASILPPDEEAAYQRSVADWEAELGDATADLVAIERAFQRREAELRGVTAGAGELVDVAYRFYRDTWSELPDFDALRPEASGALAGGRLDLAPASRRAAFGLVFEAGLPVARAGDYRFVLDADDGARLALGGEPVLEGEGGEATARLEAGLTPLRVDYFQRRGEARLALAWGPAGDDTWSYLFEEPGAGWEQPGFDDADWPRGPGGFGTPETPGARVGTFWEGADVWLRRAFTWDADDAADLVLALHHDEDVEVYLNGVLAYRASGWLGEYTTVEVAPEARASVRRGANHIALHVHDTGGGRFAHARPVHRSDAFATAPADLAFGLRSLSAEGALGPREDLARAIEERGAAVLGEGELARYRELRSAREALAAARPAHPALANVATETGPVPEPLFVHVRGNPAAPGARVEPRFPRCLDPPAPRLADPGPDAPSSLRRRALAEWIASPDNPLTARVLVNRLWQQHFGRGLVPTPNDFGELGERPTHPELLDWLACELVERGWSIKALQRLIVSSSTYRQGTRVAGEAESLADPDNALLWRFRMRRLSAEELRDSVLAVDGRLNLELGGPSFFSLVPREALETSSKPDEVWGTSPPDQMARRSAYIKVKRSLVTPLLAAFDFADTDSPCPERFVTTVPGQALALLNGEFLHRGAAALAERLERERPGDRRSQVARALRLAYGRAVLDEEVAELLAFLSELERDFGLDPAAALRELCLVILNTSEFVYLE